MRVGIITLWQSKNNYGQLLQCFALQKYLIKNGHDAFLIKYDHTLDYVRQKNRILYIFNMSKLKKYTSEKIETFFSFLEEKFHPREFQNFVKDNIIATEIKYNSYFELEEGVPYADAYIVGSDQVWNIDSKQINLINAFFLKFANQKSKIMSYSASFGKSKIENRYKEKIEERLKRFDYISVREQSGLQILNEIGFSDVHWDLDPTFLLNRNSYKDLSSNVYIADDNYCFIYLLKHKCDYSYRFIKKWAKREGVKIIFVSGNTLINRNINSYPTIDLWLKYIENAKYIITNSFHCCVFSLIFQKKFGVFSISDSNLKGMNSRIDSLFQQFNIDRYIARNDFRNLKTEIDWKRIENIREKLIKNTSILKYLQDEEK